MKFVGQTRILAVDDDEGSRKLVKAMLTPLGCQVFTASSGAEAIDLVGSGDWDAVLMDIAMPEMDGITALEIIREKYPMQDLPIVMVTGSDDMESRNRALANRANDFIVKPVDQGELMARLGNILTMRWAKREVEERLKEAENAGETMMKMMGLAVHDIRGALTCARGFVELAGSENGESGSALPGGSLQKALAAIERAAGIAGEATNVAAMSRGRLRLRLEDAELRGLLGNCISGFRGVCAMNNVVLKLDCPADTPSVHIDREIMERLVANLLSGAVRRAGAGGTVTVSVEPSGDGYQMVAVSDSGEGASRPFRQRIYDQECQEEFHDLGLDSTSGLGMSFVRMSIGTMGGKIWLDSGPGSGTRFSLLLPARRAEFPVAGSGGN